MGREPGRPINADMNQSLAKRPVKEDTINPAGTPSRNSRTGGPPVADTFPLRDPKGGSTLQLVHGKVHVASDDRAPEASESTSALRTNVEVSR